MPFTSETIPEIIIKSGSKVNVDLRSYFTHDDDDTVKYSADRLPDGIFLDAIECTLTGTSPIYAINVPFLVSVTAHSEKENEDLTEYFPITVLGTENLKESEEDVFADEELSESEEEQGIFSEVFEDVSYLEATRRWELLRWIQFIINEHYACAYMYDGQNPPDSFGQLLDKRKAKTGMSIFNYENYVVVHMGDMAFAESGNRGRFIRSLHEAFKNDVKMRSWLSIGIVGSDAQSINKAWVVGRLLKLPVADEAPSDEALFNLRNLQRLYGVSGGPGAVAAP